MRWFLILLFFVTPALAESVTTPNVLPDLSEFTTSGSTTSAGGTGHATAGGGTYTSNFSVPLTEGEIRQGFTLDSAVTINSHPSNAVLATCTSLTQASDCRDIFRLGLKLFDGTDLAANFLHEIELDFSGFRAYTFSDTFAANDFGVLTGEFSLWGIDAGYHSGTFGPIFSIPTLTFAYQTVPVEQQIIDQIIDQIVMETIAPPPPPPTETTPTSQMAGPPPPATMSTTMETQAPAPPAPPPTIEPVAPPPPEQQQREEAAATAEVEAEIQAAEPEPESSTEAAPARERDQPRQTRQQKVRAAAQKVAKKIAPSQRYSAASQTTTMVVMNMLSGRIATGVVIKDATAATFFSAANVPDGPSMIDRMQNYVLFGSANGVHNALIESQWAN
jgi:outer membrane biosynthesis protein TonB